MQTFARLIVVSFVLLLVCQAGAEEKNGLSVTVSKRTLDRSDKQSTFYYTRYDRTQGYKVIVKNTSLKPMPEGELNWTILVIKALSSSSDKYVGTEQIKALRPSESVELLVGAVPIGGYRYERDYKDQMEYELVVTHAGKETMRTTSKPAFTAMAKRAYLVRVTDDGEEIRTLPSGATTRTIRSASSQSTPAATSTTTTPPPAVRPPATAPRPATTATPPAPRPAATATATPVTPAPAATAASTPPAATTPAKDPAPGFDFFNLDKPKPAPTAK
jgi:hypothetical protein